MAAVLFFGMELEKISRNSQFAIKIRFSLYNFFFRYKN